MSVCVCVCLSLCPCVYVGLWVCVESQSKFEDVVKTLLQGGALVNFPEDAPAERKPLALAVSPGGVDTLKLLLESDPTPDLSQQGLLFRACIQGLSGGKLLGVVFHFFLSRR